MPNVHSASTESEVTAKAKDSGIGMVEAWAFVKWATEHRPQEIYQLALEYDKEKSAWINMPPFV